MARGGCSRPRPSRRADVVSRGPPFSPTARPGRVLSGPARLRGRNWAGVGTGEGPGWESVPTLDGMPPRRPRPTPVPVGPAPGEPPATGQVITVDDLAWRRKRPAPARPRRRRARAARPPGDLVAMAAPRRGPDGDPGAEMAAVVPLRLPVVVQLAFGRRPDDGHRAGPQSGGRIVPLHGRGPQPQPRSLDGRPRMHGPAVARRVPPKIRGPRSARMAGGSVAGPAGARPAAGRPCSAVRTAGPAGVPQGSKL